MICSAAGLTAASASAQATDTVPATRATPTPAAPPLRVQQRAYTGIEFRINFPSSIGHKKAYPVINRVDSKSPAEAAGLAAGDVIISVNGTDLSTTPSAAAGPPGIKEVLRIRRGGEEREVVLVPVLRIGKN